MKSLVRAAVFGALLATTALATAQAQPAVSAVAPLPGTALTIQAFGEVRTAPDLATITIGVLTQGPTANDASTANAARMNSMMAALRRAGIADRDVQTSGLNLNPQYAYEQNQPPRLTGYQANNQVTVRVMDLARLGATLDAAVGAGANEIQGVSFGLRNPVAAEDEARRRAVAALQAKASVYAQALNKPIERMVSISEGGGYQPVPPRPMALQARADKAFATPVSPGELSVRIDVDATYQLGR